MTRILLTGAGFSRNWGGWVASEAFEYLLGCDDLDEQTLRLLWRSKQNGGGFEDTLAGLADAKDEESKRRASDLTRALVGMFNAMGEGFKRRQFEFQNDIQYMVKTFLLRFDAIFTLNQDTLLEQHYLGMIPGGRWADCRTPGVVPVDSSILMTQQDKTALQKPDATFTLAAPSQPYIKLHGSCNWIEGPSSGRILIMGGQKAISIDQFPLLSWYQSQFRQFLLSPDARLMVIGYSFNDKHINDAIGQGAEHGLKLFIIDPHGVDVLDKRQKEPVGRPARDEYMAKLESNIIGASRRPPTSIFYDDVVEHGRVMKFF